MTDAAAIRRFSAELVELVELTPYGGPVVEFFGCGTWKPGDPADQKPATAGYTLAQLIETSLVSAHFVDNARTVFLDVFSCKPYDSATVARFAQAFFSAETYAQQVLNRGSITPTGGTS
jgi:hypothetical protein